MLFRPIDTASLIFFRIVFGILAFADVITIFIHKHYIKRAFQPEDFHFRYFGFEWVHPFPEPLMSIFFVLMLIASIFILIGKSYRISALFFAFGFTYIFLLEKSFYLNHGYLFCMLSFLMAGFPLDRSFSVRTLQHPHDRLTHFPYWPLFLLQFMMGAVYFFGGIAKVNPDWLNGMPLKIWLKNESDMWLIGGLWEQEWVAYFMSYSGLFLDLSAPFLLMFRKTRYWILGFILFFHFTNLLLFQIGIFPYLSVALSLLFFPPDFPKRFGNWLIGKFPTLQTWQEEVTLFLQKKYDYSKTAGQQLKYSKRQQLIIIGSITLFIVIQIILPLRHHYFKGNVAWTEEGHRYAWRMMLRNKSGTGNFTVENPITKEKVTVQPHKLLTSRQRRKMLTHPDMILQFAHYLRDKYKQKGWEDVAVYADIRVGLNGRKYQTFIDPAVDLAKIEWSFFKKSEWVIPEKSALQD